MRRRGFTLIELLIAITLFMGLAFVLYTFLRGGVEMWRTGERRADLYERAAAALAQIAEDLRCTFRPPVLAEATPAALFLADVPPPPKEGVLPPVLGSRLRFVRTLGDELRRQVMRLAGTEPGAPPAAAAPDQGEGLRALRAAGGLMEVFYQAVLAGEGGYGVLLRGTRWPADLRDPASFFREEVASDPEVWARQLKPLVAGVLHFSVSFWDPYRQQWDDEGDEAEARPGLWDSSRGLVKEFRYYRKDSFTTDRDDIYPERVRIRLLLTRPGDPALAARLSRPLARFEKVLRLTRPGGLALAPEGLVLVGGRELMRIVAAGRTRARILARGLYGTEPVDHPAEATVVWGERFEEEVAIPSFREDWNP